MRHKLLKFDSQQTTEEERKAIIEELLKNQLQSFYFGHTKPDKGEGESQQADGIDKSNLNTVEPDPWKLD